MYRGINSEQINVSIAKFHSKLRFKRKGTAFEEDKLNWQEKLLAEKRPHYQLKMDGSIKRKREETIV